MSAYGAEVTRWFVRELALAGWVIVSGLARGVDRVAAESAMDVGGRTIAVLGHGLDHTYPPEHLWLREKILASKGLLVSQYPPETPPAPERFRERNEIMVRLSRAVLVTESPQKSGTKITVRYASEVGKTVYVVPGPVTQASYQGSVTIIQNGGIPVGNPKELMGFLDSGI